MTKLLVISDIHRDRRGLEYILDAYEGKVDHIISLGDSELANEYLQRKNIIAIKGNYPFDGGQGYHKSLQVEDVKIFITHGHKFGVKRGNLEKIHDYAKSEDYDLVMYGHTHEASVDMIEGITYINPGSIRQPRGRHEASYAVVEINEDKIRPIFFDAKTLQEMTI